MNFLAFRSEHIARDFSELLDTLLRRQCVFIITGGINLAIDILNDFSAIATYAPYVDAMFVDRQCASLLRQGGFALNCPTRRAYSR